MPYGRLDVFWPDGTFRSFPLTLANVSVGRSPGTTIQLDTETISRYHFSLSNHEGEVRLSDSESQNGTFVDGVRVPEGDYVVLAGGEEISIGHLRILFHVLDELPTQPIPSTHITQQILSEDEPFTLSLYPPPISIPPGAHASAELTVINNSAAQAFYTVQVSGVPAAWVRVDRPRLMLDPQEAGQVVINIKPARVSETEPRLYDINVTVTDEALPERPITALTQLDVVPYSGFGAALEQHKLAVGERFRLHVHNHGNATLTLAVGGSPRTPNATIELVSSAQVALAPGQKLLLQGQVKALHRPLIGRKQAVPFDIVLRAQDSSHFMVVVGGTVEQTAMLPSWSPALLGTLFVGIVAFVAWLTWLITAPTPQIVSLTVPQPRIPRGEAIVIQYEVTDTQTLELFADQTLLAVIDPLAREYIIESSTLPENVMIRLEARSRNKTSTDEEGIQIYDPVRVALFEADPQQLVRNVIQTLSLRWQLENAAYVQISGLDAFTTDNLDPNQRYAASDVLTNINGRALDPLVIELYSQDALGNPYRDTFTLEVVDPICTPLSADVILLDGPSPLNQQIATIPLGSSVLVDARDNSGAWVRVQLEGALRGWGALDTLNCQNFNPAALEIDIDPPPPPLPTAMPTLPPSVSTPVSPTPGALVPPARTPQSATAVPTAAG